MTEYEAILSAALERICERCNYIKTLPPIDSYRDGLREAWGEAATIAWAALNSVKDKEKAKV